MVEKHSSPKVGCDFSVSLGYLNLYQPYVFVLVPLLTSSKQGKQKLVLRHEHQSRVLELPISVEAKAVVVELNDSHIGVNTPLARTPRNSPVDIPNIKRKR